MKISDNTKIWLHGIGAAFVGAIGSSIGTIVVAPDRFNLTTLAGAKNVILSSLVSGVGAVGLYLTKSPLPGPSVQVVESSASKTDASGNVTQAATKSTTVQE